MSYVTVSNFIDFCDKYFEHIKKYKVPFSTQASEDNVVIEKLSYSTFTNTKGGYIILDVDENKKKTKPEEHFIIQGIENPSKQQEDFWNTISSDKININILKDGDVFEVIEDTISCSTCYLFPWKSASKAHGRVAKAF